MTKFNNIFIAVITLSMAVALKSQYLLIKSMTPVLVLVIQFVLFSSVLFLVSEKQILNNIRIYYKRGLILGIIASGYFTLSAYGLSVSNPLFIGIFTLFPFFMIDSKGGLRFNGILGSIIALLFAVAALFMGKTFHISAVLFGFAASGFLTFFLYIAGKNHEEIKKGITETTFTITSVIALLSTIIFFIVKPSNAAILSEYQQIHLIILILAGTFVPLSLFIYAKGIFDDFNLIVLISVLPIILFISNYESFNWLYIPAYLTFLIVFMKPLKIKRGFSKIESIAIVTLTAVIVSLTFPVINGIGRIDTVKKDKALILKDKSPENTVSIGSIYIKSIKGKPAFVYDTSSGKFISVPIR